MIYFLSEEDWVGEHKQGGEASRHRFNRYANAKGAQGFRLELRDFQCRLIEDFDC